MNEKLEKLLKELRAYRNDMVARNYPYQEISDIITKWEMKEVPKAVAPSKRKDYEYIRWYLLHGRVSIFTEDDDWYLMVHNDCEHLLPDNRCGGYDTRPRICRDYSTKNCEYEDEWTYERYFETAEQVAEYADAVLSRKSGKNIQSSKPALLPIVG